MEPYEQSPWSQDEGGWPLISKEECPTGRKSSSFKKIRKTLISQWEIPAVRDKITIGLE
jgi:hypothetical protein